MGFVPAVRSQDAAADFPGDGAESVSAVLPQMQARDHYQCKTFYYRNEGSQTLRRSADREDDLVLRLVF